MALVDMKSNLAINAGTPLGNPDGRHDPNPDLATSRLDDGSGIPSGAPKGRHEGESSTLINKTTPFGRHIMSNIEIALTNPGGRHLDGPIDILLNPNPVETAKNKLVRKIKTKGMDYLLQKARNIPNPAKQYFSTENWKGFVTGVTNWSNYGEDDGVLGLMQSQFAPSESQSYIENFFKYISPKFELWPQSSANIGGKLLPQAVISSVLADSNLFLTDYFENTHAFGFTKNMHETRFKGAGATYDPQNERNEMLSKVGETAAFVSNVLSVGGFIKNFMGNMRNSPSKSNYKGVNEDSMTYEHHSTSIHPTPGYLNPLQLLSGANEGVGAIAPGFVSSNRIWQYYPKGNFLGISDPISTYDPPEVLMNGSHMNGAGWGNPTSYFPSDQILESQFITNPKYMESNFAGIDGEVYRPTESTLALKTGYKGNSPGYLGGGRWFYPVPIEGGKKWHGFKTQLTSNDHKGFESGENINHSTSKKFTEPKYGWGDLVDLWDGTSKYGGMTAKEIRRAKVQESKARLQKKVEESRAAAGLGPNDPGVVRATIVDGQVQNAEVLSSPGADGPKVAIADTQVIDKNDHTLGQQQGVTRKSLFPGNVFKAFETRPTGPTELGEDPGPPTPKLFAIWNDDEQLVPLENPGGSRFTSYTGGKSSLYVKIKPLPQENFWAGGTTDQIQIAPTGTDAQEKWDDIGERALSGPRAIQRATERFGRFTGAPQFLVFEAKQIALQALNATAESRLYNPLSIANSFTNLIRIPRHMSPSMTYSGKLAGGVGGLAQGFGFGGVGENIVPEGRVKFQSHIATGTSPKKPDPKKFDPNRYTGAFGGMNKLGLTGTKATTITQMMSDGFKYTQDIKIEVDGLSYENFYDIEHSYIGGEKSRGATIDSKTTMEGNFPMRPIVENDKGFRNPSEVNPAMTRYFTKEGSKGEIGKIHKIYSNVYKSKPKEISKRHSQYGDNSRGNPRATQNLGSGKEIKAYSTIDTISDKFKAKSVGAGNPEGGYGKEGYFKGVTTKLQPGKVKNKDKLEGKEGLGFSTNAKPGTDKKDWKKSGGEGRADLINTLPYQDDGGTDWQKDLVPFKFVDVYNNKAISFRAAFKSINESITPEWTPTKYMGRPDAVHTYTGTTRDMNINFVIYPYTYKEFKVLWAKLNYFVGLVYPNYEEIKNGGERMVAPWIKLSLGNLYNDIPGYLKTMNLVYDQSATWEINKGEILPKKIDVTIDFIWVGNEQIEMTSKENFGFNAEKWNKV